MPNIPAYERDPYLTEMDVYVRDVGVDQGRPFAVLDDSILYPEGGGQPADRGRLGDAAVVDVRRVGGRIRVFLAAPVETGPTKLELDWDRRYEHMQQHTAQHLLTAIAQDQFGWPTTAFHLGERDADVELDAPLLPREALDDLEETCAAAIRAALPVAARRVSPAEFATMEVRTRGLPEGFSGDVRLVEIEGIDLNTCGGTHLRSTAEIETIKLLGVEPMRGGTRLHFVAGRRARTRLAEREALAGALRQLLGAPDEELADAAGAKLEQLKDALRRAKALEEELAGAAARELSSGESPVAARHWPDRDGAFLQRVAKEFAPLAPTKVALLTAGAGEAGVFSLAFGEQAPLDAPSAARAVAETLGGRGGGSGRMFQGKASALSRRDAAAEILLRSFKSRP